MLHKYDLSLDDERVTPENLDTLLDALQDHPLSIELVGPHLKAQRPEQIVADFHMLLEQFRGDAEVERNRSLLASLRFSTSRLSEQAQAALPWLGMFRGGVFEQVLLSVSEMEPGEWDGVRAELQATALVRVEPDIQIGDRPYLRFHPTLPNGIVASSMLSPSGAEGVEDRHCRPDSEEARQRFIEVYGALSRAIGHALRGSNARGGMEVLRREEANVRRAMRWAVQADQFDVTAAMGGTFGDYLERSARLRERDQWSAWLAEAATQVSFSSAAAMAETERAWSLFTQGHAAEAVERLEALIDRLRHTDTFDPAFQLARSRGYLGRVYYHTGVQRRQLQS